MRDAGALGAAAAVVIRILEVRRERESRRGGGGGADGTAAHQSRPLRRTEGSVPAGERGEMGQRAGGASRSVCGQELKTPADDGI
ncbi:hypothetical protein GCM10023160_27840 [Brachybacterium paraconglomeratum]